MTKQQNRIDVRRDTHMTHPPCLTLQNRVILSLTAVGVYTGDRMGSLFMAIGASLPRLYYK